MPSRRPRAVRTPRLARRASTHADDQHDECQHDVGRRHVCGVDDSLRSLMSLCAGFATDAIVAVPTPAAGDHRRHGRRSRQNGALMGQAIGDLLPSAVGVALSPIPIIAVILMLGTPKARSNGPAFAVGWVLGLVIVSVIVLLLAGDCRRRRFRLVDGGRRHQAAVRCAVPAAGGQAVAGADRRQGEEAEMPKWMGAIDRLRAGQVVRTRRRPVGCQPEEPRPDVRRCGVDRPGRAQRWRERRSPSPCS